MNLNLNRKRSEQRCFSKDRLSAAEGGRLINFTLIEIVVVIGIMVVLMVVAMPTFSSMMQGAGIKGAVRNICQELKLARTYAVNNREYTAVLFPNANLGDTYHNRSYRVCLVKSDYTFKRWLSGENWSFLPVGTAIFGIDDSGVTSETNDFGGAEEIGSVDCDDIDMGTVSLKGVIFRPNGKTTKDTDSTHIGIGEGIASGGTLTNKNPDAEISNIEIGQYTGRISYSE